MKNTLNIVIVFIAILFTNTLAFAGVNTRIGLTNQDINNSLSGVNVDLDLLIPLYESVEDEAKGDMIYTQVGASGIGVADSSYLVGVGYRDYLTDNVLFGVNSFVVSDFTDNKLNLGAELSSNNYRLTANQSFSLGGWKYTRVSTNNGVDVYREKISDGFNLKAEGWLNEYPQLSGNIQYLDLDRRNGFAVGLDYTPIPLLSLGADYNISSDKKSDDVTGYIRFTYRFGKSLKEQLNPANVVNRRNLLGQKYEFASPDRSLVKVKEFVRKINKTEPSSPDDDNPSIKDPDIKEPDTEEPVIDLNYCRSDVHNHPSKGEVRLINTNKNEFASIDDVYATGYWGVGEVITIHYYFNPISTNDPFRASNATRFEFGERDTTIELISYFSDFASYNGVAGWNSFNLPPLTEQQVSQSLEVALLAMNDYDEGSNRAVINLDALPCKPLQ